MGDDDRRTVPDVTSPLSLGTNPTDDRYRWMVESVQDVIFEADPQGRWTYLNPAWERLLGHPVELSLGRVFLDFVHPDDREGNLEVFVETISSGKEKCRFEARYTTASGDTRFMEINAWIYRDADGQPMGSTGTLTDITERHLAEVELRLQATHDVLTGLPNRALLTEWLSLTLEESRSRGTSLAVLFCDIDRFKLVNDSLGHDAGDEVLRAVGQRLRRAARADDLTARFGGDEFVLVCPGLDASAARQLARRLHSAAATPLSVDGRPIVLSISVGVRMVTRVPDVNLEALATSLLRDADSAMYEAKESGRDRTEVFDEHMHTRLTERLDVETGLRLAVARRELVLDFQPQFHLVRGELVGMEALLRWQHPQRGRLLPADFIDVAEDTGLVVSLGRWVITEVCRLLAEAEGAGRPLPRVSVIVSARQLSSSLVDDVADALRQTGADPARLCLELTETTLLADTAAARGAMCALADLGIALSLDDFGTGYSSLGYLPQLPLAELKLDRSFVNRLGEHDGRAVAGAVIALADALGLETVAEGVERQSEADVLLDLGCMSAQGYLFGHPMPLAQVLGHQVPVPRRPSAEFDLHSFVTHLAR